MPSSYQQIFEYFEVGNLELMLAEIIPFKIPVLYKGSTIYTCRWMNFNIWHEICSHLDEIVLDYSRKSVSRRMQYVKGVSVIICYQFESADPPVQMFPLPSSGKNCGSSKREEYREFKICSLKLVASIYPLQINCSEIEFPYYYVRNYNILKGLLEKAVKDRIFLSDLNRERSKRVTKSKEIQTSPKFKSDKYHRRNDALHISNINIFNFSSESTSSSNIFTSTPVFGNSEFDCEANKKNCNKAFEDDYNKNNNESEKLDSLKRKINNSDENDFKIGSGRKKKKKSSSKERKENSSNKKRNKSETKIESKEKNISEEIKTFKKNENERKQTKITRFLRSSHFSIFDSENTSSDNCSFKSKTQKTGNAAISNPLKEVKNNRNKHSNKVIEKDNKDEKLNNVKERVPVDIGISLCDTLPDLLHGYEEESQGNNIKITSNISEVIPEVNKDWKSGNYSFKSDSDSCNKKISQGNEINNILEMNEEILDESHSSKPSSKSFELFSSKEKARSILEPLKSDGETSVRRWLSFDENNQFEMSQNILTSSSNTFTNEMWSDSLPDLTQNYTTKNLNHSIPSLGSTEFSQFFTKTEKKTIKSLHTNVKGRKKKGSKKSENITSEHKHKINMKDKKLSKKRMCNKGNQKPCLDSLKLSTSSHSSSSKRVKSYSRKKCSAKHSASITVKTEKSTAVFHNTSSDKHKVEDNLDHFNADNCQDKLTKKIYNDLRKLTIDDFEYHLEKHGSYLENIILGKVPIERDKKFFQGCHVPRDMSSELFVHILDETIVDGLMDMCIVRFSSIMKSSGRNIKEVLYNMLVIIPEFLKMVLLSLPCAKNNNIVTDDDCEQIFFQLTNYIDENVQY
ncbi:UNVERIFIED_CONTAM: hypothetical protein RMT77_004565 [Armadillidium vulgare]